MSKQFGSKEKSNFIEDPEELARELFGFDDETLLRELKEAEMELEQRKAEDPELEARIKAETAAGFEALMQRIHAENIKPVTEREYNERVKAEERKFTRLRPVLKVMFVAAAILVALSGMGVVVSARKEFEYQYVKQGKIKNSTLWRSGDYNREDSSLEDAYEEIYNSLGIDVVILGYKPSKMKFKEVLIDKGHARIEFTYGDKSLYLKETKYPMDQLTEYVVSDRKQIGNVYNAWLNQELIVEENKIDDGFIEYSTEIEWNDAYYYIAGVIEKEEFVKILSSLTYLQS